MEATQIVRKPLVTEKSSWEAGTHNRYAFEVDMRARKGEIKAAVEAIYNVRVTSVNTQVRKGNYFRNRFGVGKTSPWKKALVTLHEEDRIDLF